MLAAVMSGFRWSMTQILLQVCNITLSEFSYFCFLFNNRIPGPISFVYLCCIFISSPLLLNFCLFLPLCLRKPLKKEEYGKHSIFGILLTQRNTITPFIHVLASGTCLNTRFINIHIHLICTYFFGSMTTDLFIAAIALSS